ncbi:uncharacterized protein LOC134440153 isoform X1 [Engraulis encrasicolus]|uniref:uncharacterized protein LOC134440153 isoform X1 n=2 Tax=Engraulis encrasicolus TaxID=184585 RepID=UPI002FD3990C
MSTAKEPVTFFTVTSYFASHPKSVKKGLNSYNSNRVISVNVMSGGSLKGKVQASMKKKEYEVEVHVEDQEVTDSRCTCAVGLAKCHHIAALLIWAEKNMTRTDVECVWRRPTAPKTEDVVAKRLSVMAPSTSKAGIKRPVTEEDKGWTRQSLAQFGRFTGLGFILAPEIHQEFDPSLPEKLFDGILASQEYSDAQDKEDFIMTSLAVSQQQKEAIERATVGQTSNALWAAYRKKRITASNFGLVLSAVRRQSFPPSLFKTLLGEYNPKQGACACDWGIVHEKEAKKKFMEQSGETILEKGLFLSDSGLLGASPDGLLLSSNYLVEVKCPYSAREKTIAQAAEAKDFYLYVDQVTGLFRLKNTHNYWHQIQGNLHLTEATTCHLVVWTTQDMAIVEIKKDPAWVSNLKVLEIFYKDHFLPRALFNNK